MNTSIIPRVSPVAIKFEALWASAFISLFQCLLNEGGINQKIRENLFNLRHLRSIY
jgi:hypothetical protein